MGIYDFDLYNHPECLNEVKKELTILSEQIKIVEGLEHARARLAATRSLDSNTLSKCDVFMRCVNDNAFKPDFALELRKLSWDGLAFCSISFEERRIRYLVRHLKASDIRTYMKNVGVSCLDRPEVSTRLNRLSAESQGKPFHEYYTTIHKEHHVSLASASAEPDDQMDDDTWPAPKPRTTAIQPGAFEFPAAPWTNIEKVFPIQVATAIRHVPPRINDPNITDCVRSRFPRGRGDGDAAIWLDIETIGIHPLLCGSGPGVLTTQIKKVFGDTVAYAIEESDLRKWEKENGLLDTTECVKVKRFCHVELRIACDTTIAQNLFS
ncbi:uncharacterized protein N7446_003930 [Penicillium canescens]|uniref:Uncharacterized protein n=1 Tax=Penicillium canescens TaxID=5083 RepID=A0AAD6N412_PENCN|nr:uncharacterized protein N7446_003930 [Penicillium canescens]KAJ6027478.1 hypothetical protein N7460_012295 [Penicillium canescens]KAJ6040752.1 hypothetical protein N7444_009657 [Penicillium canescens]KAJ6066893.1 hypothetical protein N7446_003930 [Penicillium canescens]